MAQTIYQEWFVKFRFSGCDRVKMVESDLGLIPEGWEVKKLEDVCITTLFRHIYGNNCHQWL